ncbi:hypothetical protein FPY71_10990 [Aureimonas fodinaquatilis]|uniref:Uncharacterized protein n=1 Tax=Aureimonas fodinaquatilis TaxID=2565783 RepID=A0A5B0DX94_9HYPH|nr:hypothetical protein [Aureimonas fodinaquatilis]KAA0970978.1 hypothetical protein FPY71_10990 [Aureimonas fodinaquatilis]
MSESTEGKADKRLGRQLRLVETLRQRLSFELLLLNRMQRRAMADMPHAPRAVRLPLTLRDVRLRALERRALILLANCESADMQNNSQSGTEC